MGSGYIRILWSGLGELLESRLGELLGDGLEDLTLLTIIKKLSTIVNKLCGEK